MYSTELQNKSSSLRFKNEEYLYFYKINRRIVNSVLWTAANKISASLFFWNLFPYFKRFPHVNFNQMPENWFFDPNGVATLAHPHEEIDSAIKDEEHLLREILKSRQWLIYRSLKTIAYYTPSPWPLEELKVKGDRILQADFSTLVFRLLGSMLYKFFSKFSLKDNWILFESHRGLSFSCNPKYLYLEVQKQLPHFKCIWSFASKKAIPVTVNYSVKRFGLRYYYYLSRSKYLVNNASFLPDIPYRDNQVYINTQHGTPLKKMGSDMQNLTEDSASKRKDQMTSMTYKWNLLASPNQHSSDVFRRCFKYEGPIAESGYPRNDIFYAQDAEDRVIKIKSELGIPQDKKIILYAPTWRDTKSKTIDKNFKLKLDLQRLSNLFSEKFVILLRLHHLISNKLDIPESLEGFSFNMSSNKYDMQELLLVADVLITDYSSVMFDYANLDRHQIFFTYDYDEYASAGRGVYFDLKKIAPGPVVSSSSEVEKCIENIDVDYEKYTKKRMEFKRAFCEYETGNAAHNIVRKVFVEHSMGHNSRPVPIKNLSPVQHRKKNLRQECFGVNARFHPLLIHPFCYLKSRSKFVSDQSSSFPAFMEKLKAKNHKKVVIFGNADCLNEIDYIDSEYFKLNGYLTIGLNRSIFKLVTDIVMWTDIMTISDILQDRPVQQKKTTYLHVKLPRDHRLPAVYDKSFKEIALFWINNKNFRSWTKSNLFLFRNILVSALHLCFKLEVKEVILVGFNMETRNYFFHGEQNKPDVSYELRSSYEIDKLCQGYSTQRIVKEVLEYLIHEEGMSIKFNGESSFLHSIPGLTNLKLCDLPGINNINC